MCYNSQQILVGAADPPENVFFYDPILPRNLLVCYCQIMRVYKAFFFSVLAIVFILSSCQTRSTIANNIQEREANEIVVLLQSKGVQAEKIPSPKAAGAIAASAVQLWDITVPAAQLTQAISLLNQTGLPRLKGTSLLDLFGSQGLVPSDLQDRIRYQEGLSEQLATTIRKMDGIIDANVQVTMQQEGDLAKPLTASVYVKHRGILDNPNSLLVTKIKRLVASSVPGLGIDNVTVIADRAMYADIVLPITEQGGAAEATHYVSIWSIVIAKESVWRFRLIFYFLLIAIFLCLSALIWLLWKFYPLIEEKGAKTLLHLQPLKPDDFRQREEM